MRAEDYRMRHGAPKQGDTGQAGGAANFHPRWGPTCPEPEEVPSLSHQADNSSYVHPGVREALSSGRAGCGGPCPRSLGKERFQCLRVVCVWVWPMAPVCLSQCAHAGLAHLWKVCLSRPVAWASFVSGAGVCIRLAARVFLCLGRVWSIRCSSVCICLWGTSGTRSCVQKTSGQPTGTVSSEMKATGGWLSGV